MLTEDIFPLKDLANVISAPNAAGNWKMINHEKWMWGVTYRKALKAAKVLLPFVRIKKKEIQSIIDFYGFKNKGPY